MITQENRRLVCHGSIENFWTKMSVMAITIPDFKKLFYISENMKSDWKKNINQHLFNIKFDFQRYY